jgi:hypothetical protein
MIYHAGIKKERKGLKWVNLSISHQDTKGRRKRRIMR